MKKMTNGLLLAVLLCATQSAFALKIRVINNIGPIEVFPLFTGNSTAPVQLGGSSSALYTDYNSYLHHLRGFYVRQNGLRYYFNLEQYGLRGTGAIEIHVNDASELYIVGYKDMVRKQGTQVSFTVKASSILNSQRIID